MSSQFADGPSQIGLAPASSPTSPQRRLAERVAPLRRTDNLTNLGWIAAEWASLAAALAVGIAAWQSALPLAAKLPIAILTVVAVGALQHRLAGLAHEASHYTLFKGRLWNELASDLFCMLPIFSSTHQYRLVHIAHHQHVNDWERDPDLAHIGHSKLMDRFPMSKGRFAWTYFAWFFWPPTLLRYWWDVTRLSALGQAGTALSAAPARWSLAGVRLPTLLGMGYFLALGIALPATASRFGLPGVLALAGGFLAAGLAVCLLLPGDCFLRSPLKNVYSSRFQAGLRLVCYTGLLGGMAAARALTGVWWGGYFLAFWLLPLMTSFGYFMLLRDVYQHANADRGRLTNSRVFRVDPFTRWAVFVYGQDMHVPHHLYTAVPHYRLAELHAALKDASPEYAAEVVECEGTFANRSGRPTILDVMQERRPADGAGQPAGSSTSGVLPVSAA